MVTLKWVCRPHTGWRAVLALVSASVLVSASALALASVLAAG